MRAKRGCISTLRAAGFSEHCEGCECRKRARRHRLQDRDGQKTQKVNNFVSGLNRRNLRRVCAAVPCLSVPSHTEAALYASLTHRKDLLCLHISYHPSLPPPSLPSFRPMPAPIQKLGTPWEQLQQGFQCRSSRDTPPALQPYEGAVCVCVCVCTLTHVCDTFLLAQDSLFKQPTNAQS